MQGTDNVRVQGAANTQARGKSRPMGVPLKEAHREFKGNNMENRPANRLAALTSEDMVEALTLANTMSGNLHHQQVLREALHALVRLAKAEKLWEIKRDCARAAGLAGC